MKEIYQFITLICKDLKINKPKIQIANVFLSKTQLASYDPNKKLIIIKKDFENYYDMFFAISHEIRHKYQIDKGLFNFENYKQVNEISNYDYNMQKEELDANAYAYIIMASAFGVEAKFNGLEENIINKIKERANEIIEQEDY